MAIESEFNAASYLYHNPDVAAAAAGWGMTPEQAAWHHYQTSGETRYWEPYTAPVASQPQLTPTATAPAFNAASYLYHNPDVAAAAAGWGMTPEQAALWHYQNSGETRYWDQNSPVAAPTTDRLLTAAPAPTTVASSTPSYRTGDTLTDAQINQLLEKQWNPLQYGLGYSYRDTHGATNVSQLDATRDDENRLIDPKLEVLIPVQNPDGTISQYLINLRAGERGQVLETWDPKPLNQFVSDKAASDASSGIHDLALAAMLAGTGYGLASEYGLLGSGSGGASAGGDFFMAGGEGFAPTLAGTEAGAALTASQLTSAGVAPAAGAAAGGGLLSGAGAGGAAAAGSTLGSTLGKIGTTIGGALTGGAGLANSLLGAGASLIGGALQNQTNRDIANQNADLIRQANEDKRFRPVGVTTRFGQSQFGYDANGRLTSANYTLNPELRAMQDRQMGMLPGLQSDYERAVQLGRGAMKTPQEFIAEQQGLLQPDRERALAEIRNRAQQTGRGGLATMGTSTTMATNPELAAYYNAIQQENARLAANAPQQSLALASQGLGLMSEGYKPFATALGGAQNMETLGQGAMDIGTQLGAQASTAGARLQTPQMPNQVNPFTAAINTGLSAWQQYQDRNPVTTQNPYVPTPTATMWDPANTPVTVSNQDITFGW